MKRKVIDAILAKVGIKPFADSDPRYSEPLSIAFSSRNTQPAAPLLQSVSSNSTGSRSASARPTCEQVEANRKYNLGRLAAFDQRAASARLKQMAEANLETVRVRHLQDKTPDPDQTE